MARTTDKDERLKIIIALKIQEMRIKSGLSQTDVALALNLGRPTIANIELANQATNSDLIWKLSHLLCCEISDFFPLKEDLEPNLNPISMTSRLKKNAKLMNRLDELNKKIKPLNPTP